MSVGYFAGGIDGDSDVDAHFAVDGVLRSLRNVRHGFVRDLAADESGGRRGRR